MSDKIRKYVLPNLPYLFVFWFFSKIGTAYRIAPGTDFGTKLMGMLDTFPKAFETYWPGLGGIDLLVGLAGAAGVYLLIQSKIRQAKKFRRDAEYGTARFGTKEDIKPFVDPKFQNNVILTGTEFLTMNTRPKIPANARNLNACVIGSSGSGKTRFWLTPQLLQAHSSYVVVDPKGGTLDQCGRFLQREKYRVRVFNSIDFSKSMHYNPLAYIKTESDVLKFVTALIANTKGDGKEGDEFWTKAETLLYCALVAYIVFEGPEEERNMNTLVEMINSMEVREDDETFKNAVDYMFDGLERRSPQHFAVRQYKKYKLASGVVWKVYFDGDFWGHRGKDRAGKEIKLDKQFDWAGYHWVIPAAYSCSKGLVVDFCMRVDSESIRDFMKKWNLDWENAVIRDIKKKIALLFDWIAEAKAELAKPQAPDLVSLLNAYYTQRRAGAYSQKGKVSNLKEMNETFNYLRANGIYSLEDLERRVSEHSAATESLKKTLDEQTARMKAIKRLYDSSAAFQSLKPVYDGLQKIKFEKPRAKYKAEHETELKQFYAARRKLTGEFPDGKVDMKKLTEEYDELEQAHNTTYGEFKTVRDDLHRLWKVKSCVDTAARFNERTEEQMLQNRPQTRQKKEDMTR